MNKIIISVICAAVLLAVNGTNASAAAKSTKKADTAKAESMQNEKYTMLGILAKKEMKDGAGKVTGSAYFLTDSKGKDWKLPPSSKVKYGEFEDLKVKMTGVRLGGSLSSVSTMEAIDKAAYEAKQAEIKAAAEAKKAAAQKK
jgi:hypothetical protein